MKELVTKELGGKKKPVVLDVGCGSCGYWVDFLKKHKHISFFGVDINKKDIGVARRNLPLFADNILELNGRNLSQVITAPVDVIVSKSALEHVYKRKEFLSALTSVMSTDTVLIMNWDYGHFRTGKVRDVLYNGMSVVLAVLGIERFYTQEVNLKKFKSLLSDSGLKILDEKYFNILPLKEIINQSAHVDLSKRILDFELDLNELVSNKQVLHANCATVSMVLKKIR